MSDDLLNFVLVVFSKGREILLRDILREYRVLHDEHIGLVRVQLTTAIPLSEEQVGSIRTRLESALGKTVEIGARVEKDLLGGFVIRYDGMVADSSLRSALEIMGDRMLSVRFGSEMIHEN